MTFEELQIQEDILRALRDMGFEEPTPVQCAAIPPLLDGKDVMAQALTGTGKTAAFGIPIVGKIDRRQHGPQAIVLEPTRELAVQVSDEIYRIGRYRQIRVLPIYGGQSYEVQIRALQRGIDVAVATPGRLMDHMRQGRIDLSHIQTLILDEADEMLNMGFLEDVEFIMANLPADRQTAIFSATLPDPILELARQYMRDPQTIQLSQKRNLTVPTIEQSYYVVPFRHKLDALTRLIDVKRPERSIVFVGTKRMVDEVSESLASRGYSAEPLHGDMSQAARERTMRGFREGRLDILVATDVAARGIDVEDVTHVFNFDMPHDPEYYVHRIGRTGRVGKRGEAITLVNPREQRELRVIERVTGARIQYAEVPTAAEVEEREREIVAERVERTLEEGRWGPYLSIVQELVADHDPVEVAAAALSLISQRQRRSHRREPPATIGSSDRESEPARAAPSVRDEWGTRDERPDREDRPPRTAARRPERARPKGDRPDRLPYGEKRSRQAPWFRSDRYDSSGPRGPRSRRD